MLVVSVFCALKNDSTDRGRSIVTESCCHSVEKRIMGNASVTPSAIYFYVFSAVPVERSPSPRSSCIHAVPSSCFEGRESAEKIEMPSVCGWSVFLCWHTAHPLRATVDSRLGILLFALVVTRAHRRRRSSRGEIALKRVPERTSLAAVDTTDVSRAAVISSRLAWKCQTEEVKGFRVTA